MDLCIGAVSHRVIEETARLQVPQIVASRRQVAPGGGYTGYDPESLVRVARDLSDGHTAVVRDHGGPHQDGSPDDDWVEAFDIDVDAGFDALHIDVCKLPRDEQPEALAFLLERYGRQLPVEVGGERDKQEWLEKLIDVAFEVGVTPSYAVVDLGGHAWGDRQVGTPQSVERVARLTERYHKFGVHTKAHNMDEMGGRLRYSGALDAYNVAPEFARVEIDAWMRVMTFEDATTLLSLGYESGAWTRWFHEDEGTQFERARCGVRYIMNSDDARELFDRYDDTHVRESIRDAILAG